MTRLQGFIEWVIKRSRAISAVGIVLTIALTGIAFTLRPDDKLEYSMPSDSKAYQALAFCDREFGGIQFAQFEIKWNESIPTSSPKILAAIRDAQAIAEKEPLLNHPLSINDILATFPVDSEELETQMSFAELMPGSLRNLFFKPDKREATVLMRIQDKGIAAYVPVFDRVEKAVLELEAKHPGFDIELTGWPVRRGRRLYENVVDLATSLGSVSIVILVILGFAYRSLRIGLITIIPNLLPLVVTGTLLVILGRPLDMVAVCAFTVCLGIAVDDSIHFLSRFQYEATIDGDISAAVQRTFHSIGTALVMTTVVLIAGFASVLVSDMPVHRVFAAMACSTIGAALIADLVFLPALLACFCKQPPASANVSVEDEQAVSVNVATDSG